MLSFALSKFMRSDSILSSDLVTPPSHSPVSGMGAGDGTGVAEGIAEAVGTAGLLDAPQADRQSDRRSVKHMRRMDGSISPGGANPPHSLEGYCLDEEKYARRRTSSMANEANLIPSAIYNSTLTGVTTETAFGRSFTVTGRRPIMSPSPCT
jgi:hypothetical protein